MVSKKPCCQHMHFHTQLSRDWLAAFHAGKTADTSRGKHRELARMQGNCGLN